MKPINGWKRNLFWKIFLNLRLSSKKYQKVAYFLNKKTAVKKSLTAAGIKFFWINYYQSSQ